MRFTFGDVQRTVSARDADEEPVEQDPRLVEHDVAKLVGGRWLEAPRLAREPRRGSRERGEVRGGGERAHGSTECQEDLTSEPHVPWCLETRRRARTRIPQARTPQPGTGVTRRSAPAR